MERGQTQEVQSSVIEGAQWETGKSPANEKHWPSVQSRVKSGVRGSPSIVRHIVVLFTNPGTPAGGACVGEDAESTLEWNPHGMAGAEGHPGGSI